MNTKQKEVINQFEDALNNNNSHQELLEILSNYKSSVEPEDIKAETVIKDIVNGKEKLEIEEYEKTISASSISTSYISTSSKSPTKSATKSLIKKVMNG